MKRIRTMVVVGLLCGLVVGAAGRGAVAAGAAPASAAARVNINTASAEELVQLPGIGPSLARAIVAHRSGAPFKRTEDLRDVRGIGNGLYERLKDQVTVSEGSASKVRGD